MEDSREIQDSGFTMEMFTLQEEIEDADKETCQEIKTRILGIMKNIQFQFDRFFKT